MTIEWDGGHLTVPASLIWLALGVYLLSRFLQPIVEGLGRALVPSIREYRQARRLRHRRLR